jgi:hypothetical protein
MLCALLFMHYEDQQLDGEVRLTVKSNIHLILFSENVVIPVTFRPGMVSGFVVDKVALEQFFL